MEDSILFDLTLPTLFTRTSPARDASGVGSGADDAELDRMTLEEPELDSTRLSLVTVVFGSRSLVNDSQLPTKSFTLFRDFNDFEGDSDLEDVASAGDEAATVPERSRVRMASEDLDAGSTLSLL